MENMKVSDVFNLPVFYEHDPLSEIAKFSGWHGGESICKSLFLAFDDSDADTICHAINNHDRLVEENAQQRESLDAFRELVKAQTKTMNELNEKCKELEEERSELREALKNSQQVMNTFGIIHVSAKYSKNEKCKRADKLIENHMDDIFIKNKELLEKLSK